MRGLSASCETEKNRFMHSEGLINSSALQQASDWVDSCCCKTKANLWEPAAQTNVMNGRQLQQKRVTSCRAHQMLLVRSGCMRHKGNPSKPNKLLLNAVLVCRVSAVPHSDILE